MTETIPESIELQSDPEATPRRGGLDLASITLLVGIVLAGVVIALALARQNETQMSQGLARDFSIETFDGETYQLSDFRGKVVVMNFWASWCGPCRLEAPELEATWQKYKDNNVVLLGIAYADNGPRSLEFIDEYGITYLNAPDLGTRISDAYNIQGVPETFIIDQEGNIVQFIFAGVTEAQLSPIIDDLLSEGA